MSTESVYTQLRGAIASGRLHPNERLVEADLMSMFTATRAAVRTALIRLDQEGLVEHERNRGAKVRFVDEREAVEIYETRSSLEALAARKAAEHATAADIDELTATLDTIRRELDSGDLMAASDRNMVLHETILRISDHRTAQRLVSTLNSNLIRFHYRTILKPGRPQHSFDEHAAIVRAIANHDPDAAETAMRVHLQKVTATLGEPVPDSDR